MYDLTLVNKYLYPVKVAGKPVKGSSIQATVDSGQTDTFDNLGNVTLTIPGMGEVDCLDLAEKKLPGMDFPKEYWGALFRHQTIDVYYRYEGQGKISLTIDELGTIDVKASQGTAVLVSLPEFTLS